MDDRDSDERQSNRSKLAAPSLRAAVRRARLENAEKSEAMDDLRQTELLRLGALAEAIRPIIDQAPEGADLFDLGIAHGERPRLFIDMIAFVDMGHDRRTYRFFQDTRYGRVLIAESHEPQPVVTALTNYIARRLGERERALATDDLRRAPSPFMTVAAAKFIAAAAPPPRRLTPIVVELFRRLLMTLGAFALAGLIGLAAWLAWEPRGRALWTAFIGPPPF